MFSQDKLNLIIRRFDEISAKLSAGAEGQSYVALSRERATLEGVVEAIETWRTSQQEITDLDAILIDPSTDGEMRSLASERISPSVEGSIRIASRSVISCCDVRQVSIASTTPSKVARSRERAT